MSRLALDALTRASLQDELSKIVNTINTTDIMVTHDIDEAILLADRVVLMTSLRSWEKSSTLTCRAASADESAGHAGIS